MARSVSVKIPTTKVIEMIEAKIAEMETENASYPQRKSEYLSEMTELTKVVLQIAVSNLANPEKVSLNKGYRCLSINIENDLVSDLVIPTEPHAPTAYGRENRLSELKKTLKLLQLTDQPSVTSSTYNSVLDLL